MEAIRSTNKIWKVVYHKFGTCGLVLLPRRFNGSALERPTDVMARFQPEETDLDVVCNVAPRLQVPMRHKLWLPTPQFLFNFAQVKSRWSPMALWMWELSWASLNLKLQHLVLLTDTDVTNFCAPSQVFLEVTASRKNGNWQIKQFKSCSTSLTNFSSWPEKGKQCFETPFCKSLLVKRLVCTLLRSSFSESEPLGEIYVNDLSWNCVTSGSPNSLVTKARAEFKKR